MFNHKLSSKQRNYLDRFLALIKKLNYLTCNIALHSIRRHHYVHNKSYIRDLRMFLLKTTVSFSFSSTVQKINISVMERKRYRI